ncbi:MAG TPA: Asp-tRNA(Asn)/Glu-tRNA(Gln) amidotransferase subunit GatC [Candidatus Paceibacterota bacterium]
MADILNKKSLEHLAELARLELKSGEETKMLKDLEEILEYFKELQKVDVSKVEPMTGGTSLRSVVREDVVDAKHKTGQGVSDFPESDKNYLKVPPVF